MSNLVYLLQFMMQMYILYRCKSTEIERNSLLDAWCNWTNVTAGPRSHLKILAAAINSRITVCCRWTPATQNPQFRSFSYASNVRQRVPGSYVTSSDHGNVHSFSPQRHPLSAHNRLPGDIPVLLLSLDTGNVHRNKVPEMHRWPEKSTV